MFNLTTCSKTRLPPQNVHPLCPEDPGRCLAHLICAGDLIAPSEKASERLERLQRTFTEQMVRSSSRGLLAGLCCDGRAGMDPPVLAAGEAAPVPPPWDAEHCTHWPVMVGGWWDIKAPRDLCRPWSPQICRSLGCWGEAGAGQRSSRCGGHSTGSCGSNRRCTGAESEVFSGH